MLWMPVWILLSCNLYTFVRATLGRPFLFVLVFRFRDVEGAIPYQISTTLLARGVWVGLAAARSRCGSNTTLWCFSLPPRHCATHALARAKANLAFAPTVRQCTNKFIWVFIVRKFLKGAWGKLLSRSFPHKNRISTNTKGKNRFGFSLLLCIYRKPLGCNFITRKYMIKSVLDRRRII